MRPSQCPRSKTNPDGAKGVNGTISSCQQGQSCKPQDYTAFVAGNAVHQLHVVWQRHPAWAEGCIMHQEGRRVLLLERDLSQPDRIVGELLQPGGFLKLKALGLEDCVDDIDSQKVRTALLISPQPN